MIRLALWLVSVCVVAFFVLWIGAFVIAFIVTIVKRIRSVWEGNTSKAEPYIVGTATADATANADAAEARGLAELKAYAELKTRRGR